MQSSIAPSAIKPAQPDAGLAWRVQMHLESGCDLVFPLHSPLPPQTDQADADTGIGTVPAKLRSRLAILCLATMARTDNRDRVLGLSIPEIVHSVQEWYARRPDWHLASGPLQLRSMWEAIGVLAGEAALEAFQKVAPNFEKSAEAAGRRPPAVGQSKDKGRGQPETNADANASASKTILKTLAADIFGTPELAALRPTVASSAPLPGSAAARAAHERLLQPASRRALLSRLFLKLRPAHLALPAPQDGKPPHRLESTAVGLLPMVMAEGAAHLQPVAALLARGLAAGAPVLDDAGLPRCFGRETLQSPADLQNEARLALLGTDQPPTDTALAALLDAVLTLARDLARAITDPMRADALGFDSACFQAWATQLEHAAKPARLPARLQREGDDATANYLAQDFLPRMKRWKDQHSAMGGQPAKAVPVDQADQLETVAGMVGALKKILLAGSAADRAALALPQVQVRPGQRSAASAPL